MHVEQAIFTSARTRHTQGYHLTSRSPGIADDVAQALASWSPSHGALIDSAVDAVSWNYFLVKSNVAVLARSVYGGPEYSDRGGLQLVTRMLVFPREQLEGYGNNPLNLARIVLALGHLRLDDNLEQPLQPIELPDRTALAHSARDREMAEPVEAVRELAVRLRRASRVAVVGADDPWQLLEQLFQQTAPQERTDVSFTTGLKPSMHRSFRVQFLQSVDPRLRGQLASQGIECVDLAMSPEPLKPGF